MSSWRKGRMCFFRTLLGLMFSHRPLCTIIWKFGRWRSRWKLRCLRGIFVRGVNLTKNNFARCDWRGSKKCHEDETIKYLFFRCSFAYSIWSAIQISSTLYPLRSVANIFVTWFNDMDPRFKLLIRCERLSLFNRYAYVEMTWFLIINGLPFCKSSTG
jgi:hypothetical protein